MEVQLQILSLLKNTLLLAYESGHSLCVLSGHVLEENIHDNASTQPFPDSFQLLFSEYFPEVIAAGTLTIDPFYCIYEFHTSDELGKKYGQHQITYASIRAEKLPQISDGLTFKFTV